MLLTPLAREAIYWIIVALCLVAEAAILRSTFRIMRRGASRIGAPSASRFAPLRPPVEVLWAILPPAALALLLVFAHRALRP
jgi:hypothetical protein